METTGFHLKSGNAVAGTPDAITLELIITDKADGSAVETVPLNLIQGRFVVAQTEADVAAWPDEIVAKIRAQFEGAEYFKTITADEAYSYLKRIVPSNPTTPDIISNLRITDITQTDVIVRFDLAGGQPDVVMEIDKGAGFEPMGNAGAGFGTHGYQTNGQTTLTPDTPFTIRLSPVGDYQVRTISDRTLAAGAIVPTTTSKSSTTFSSSLELAAGAPAQLWYRVVGEPSFTMRVPEETTSNHATHNQTAPGTESKTLNPEDVVEYYWRYGASLEFQSPTIEVTLNPAGAFTAVNFNTVSRDHNRDNSSYGNWLGVAGCPAPPSGANQWMKIAVDVDGEPTAGGGVNNGHYGASRKFQIPITAGYNNFRLKVQYYMAAGNDCNAANMAASLKAPGISGWLTGGPYGGQGGLWAGLCRGYSFRGLISEEGTEFAGLSGGNEVYHRDSPNYNGGATAANHPCIDGSNSDPIATGLRQNGETIWTNTGTGGHTSPKASTSLDDFQWHFFEDELIMNTIGNADGECRRWFDGQPSYERTGLNWSDNDGSGNGGFNLRDPAFWLDVYHGGGAEAAGLHHVFFSDFGYELEIDV